MKKNCLYILSFLLLLFVQAERLQGQQTPETEVNEPAEQEHWAEATEEELYGWLSMAISMAEHDPDLQREAREEVARIMSLEGEAREMALERIGNLINGYRTNRKVSEAMGVVVEQEFVTLVYVDDIPVVSALIKGVSKKQALKAENAVNIVYKFTHKEDNSLNLDILIEKAPAAICEKYQTALAGMQQVADREKSSSNLTSDPEVLKPENSWKIESTSKNIIAGITSGEEVKEEQVAHIGARIPQSMLNEGGHTVTFISPAGKLVILPAEVKSVVFSYGFDQLDFSSTVTGTLHGFTLDDYYVVNEGGAFYGYQNSKGEKYSHDFSDEELEKASVSAIMLLPGKNLLRMAKINATGLALEDFGVSDLLDESNFTLRPFSANNNLLSKIDYTLENLPDVFNLQDHRQELTENGLNFIGDPSTAYVLPKAKIAQIMGVYPALTGGFHGMVSNPSFPDYEKYVDLRKSDEYAYWIQFIADLKIYIGNSQQSLQQKLAALSPDCKNYEWESIMMPMSIGDYESLSLDQRVLLLRISSKFISIGLGDKWIRNLVIYTPDTDRPALMERLLAEKDANQQKVLLHRLLIDFKGVDGKEFTELVTVLANWVFEYYPMPEGFGYIPALQNNKYLSYHPDYWSMQDLSQNFTEDGKVVLQTIRGFKFDKTQVTVSPYEYVVLALEGDITLAGHTFSAGTRLSMPALLVYMIFNNSNTRDIVKTIRITADVSLMVIGVGELMAINRARSAFTIVKSVADIGFGISDLTVMSYEDELSRSPQGQELLDAWGQVVLAYGIGSIGSELIKTQLMRMQRSIDGLILQGRFYTAEGQLLKELTAAELLQLKSMPQLIEQRTGLSAVSLMDEVEAGLSAEIRAIAKAGDIQVEVVGEKGVSLLSGKGELLGEINNGIFKPVKLLDEGSELGVSLQGHKLIKGTEVGFLNSAMGGGRFIAKSGAELRTHLNEIVNKPLGKTYNGDIYRSLSKASETNYGALPDQMTDHHIYSSWGRYDLPGEENSMYLSKTVSGNQTELVPHYGAWNDFSTYKYSNVEADNLLDLTDDVVRQQLGTDFEQLTKVLNDKSVMYEFTNELAKWARQNGYNGLIVPGARGVKNYENVIIFEQSYINLILKGKTSTGILK